MDPQVAALIAELGDIGGAGLFALLVLRYPGAFRQMLEGINEARLSGQEAMRNFAARRSVILARPMWWLIHPILVIAAIVSTAFAYPMLTERPLWFFSNVAVKLGAIGLAIITHIYVSSVKMVDYSHASMVAVENADADVQQRVAERRYGKPWLFLPMIFVGFLVLATMTLAVGSDAVMTYGKISFFYSMFLALIASVMLDVTLDYVRFAGFTLRMILSVGIDLVGGAWSGAILQAFAIIFPGLTNKNVLALLGFTEDEQEVAKDRLRVEFGRFFQPMRGMVAVFGLWFICFHGFLALIIELTAGAVLVRCQRGYGALAGGFDPKVYRAVVLSIVLSGAVVFFIRLITSTTPGDDPVIFYRVVYDWVSGLGSANLGCYIKTVPGEGLVVVFFLALVVFWISSQFEGKRSVAMWVVAAVLGLAVVGAVTARALMPNMICPTGASATVVAVASAPVGTVTTTVVTTAGATHDSGSHDDPARCVYDPSQRKTTCYY